mgnify:CR=1 FL=1
MTGTIRNFEDLIAPLSGQRFMNDYYDRAWLHLPGDAERTEPLMSWNVLNRILGMNIWTNRSLELSLDGQKLPPHAYCDQAADRNHQQTLRPNPEKVMQLAQRGASLVLNEVETLHEPVRAIVAGIETALGARASANVYCSWQHHQAFQSHFDRHDVFALQVLGEKRWNIYRGRTDNPIEHALFHNIPQTTYDQLKGPIDQQLIMRPGDLLYLPRGQFHDALATEQASIHVTFSATAPNGLDWLTNLWNEAVTSSEFRAYLPRVGNQADEKALEAHIRKLLQELADIALSPESLRALVNMRENYGILPKPYDLPGPDRDD